MTKARATVPATITMVETDSAVEMETPAGEGVLRVYEVGYNIIPTVKEDELEKIVSAIRGDIEKAGGSFIAEGAPTSLKLSYEMAARNPGGGGGAKKTFHDRAYFGWIKFEASVTAAQALETALKLKLEILRSIVFQTVREDTRAKMKAPTLREVRRTDTIKAASRYTEVVEERAPVSEEDLEKVLKNITAE